MNSGRKHLNFQFYHPFYYNRQPSSSNRKDRLEEKPYSAHIEPKQTPDEKLLKLRPVVKIKKLNFRKTPYYKKRSREEPEKTQNLDEKLAMDSPRVVLEK